MLNQEFRATIPEKIAHMTERPDSNAEMTAGERWRNVWKDASFRRRFLLTLTGMLTTVFALGVFLDFIEQRSGIVLADPLLDLFSPVDVTWLTFLIIYLSAVTAVASLATRPDSLTRAMQAYILIMVMRIISMYMLPLDPPPMLIPLADPFVESLSSGTLTRDLFFSGHTSTLLLFFLTAEGKTLRNLFLGATILVGVCVLIQHVHYTIDVLAAPVYSYTGYRISIMLSRKPAGVIR